MTTFIKAFNDNKINILIPLLQRDYVQGGIENVISPFLDQIFKGSPLDLNYIYGYDEKSNDEKSYFVPIDGQQRLTTLWLLHLYAAAKADKMDEFHTDLIFKGREFAKDFCISLKLNLPKILLSQTETKKGKLSYVIKDQGWFITSWLSSLTVRCMLKALDFIHFRFLDESEICSWEKLKSDNCHVTFSFLKMDGEAGLDDDIYIKMNGRGRALSDFENLKSWMDEHAFSESEIEREAWRLNVDNEWTNFFWKNRNLHQDHPEEIDDEQLFCFCNLLILFWMYGPNYKSLVNQFENLGDYLKEEFHILLTKKEGVSHIPSDEILSLLFDYLQEGNMLPLVWIERLNLMNYEFFKFAKNALDTLSQLSDKFSKYQDITLKRHLYFGDLEGNTLIYNLALRKGSYGKSLPMLYAVILMCNVNLSEEELYQRLRVMRNLIENSSIGKKELQEKILTSIKSLSLKLNEVSHILRFLNNGTEVKDMLKGFTQAQIDEEISKAKFDGEDLMLDIEEMENSSFFRGKIACMFDFLKGKEKKQDKDGYDVLTEENFQKYKAILMTIFPSKKDGGVAKSLDDPEYLLRRALLAMPNHDYGCWQSGWSYCQDSENWRAVLLGYAKDANNSSIRELVQKLSEEVPNINELFVHDFLKKYVDKKSAEYFKIMEENNAPIFYWMYFVCHPGIWKYMGTKVIRWENENDIFLKTSNGNNSNKMELRTYALYLDFCETSIHENMKNMWKGWNLGIWQRGDTCFYFYMNVSIKELPEVDKIKIDVYHNRNKEDDYVYNLFVRTKDGKVDPYLNKEFFSRKEFKPIIEEYGLSQVIVGDGVDSSSRFLPKGTFSRAEIVRKLSTLLPNLRDIVNNQDMDH